VSKFQKTGDILSLSMKNGRQFSFVPTLCVHWHSHMTEKATKIRSELQ